MVELKILLVDDDKNIRTTLGISLTKLGHKVQSAASVAEALDLLDVELFDLILTDYKMEEATGIDLINEVQKRKYDTLCAMMTAYASFDHAVQVIKEGAFDYLPKPFSKEQLEYLLKKVTRVVELKRENKRLRQENNRPTYFENFSSHSMKHLEDFVRRVAATDATILISGESGTGKSALAKVIHNFSNRAEGPFMEVHCTNLPQDLIESELFGHEKGSFTGAHKDKTGKILEAKGGTLFLDEIGELPPAGQAKLLRFIQEKVIEPVGSNKPIEVDTRIIAATNKNLAEMVQEGSFREDLYYRLNMFECLVPPLRNRREDIPVLIKRFLQETRSKMNRGEDFIMDSALNEKLLHYNFPGNVRELKNLIERLCFLSSGPNLSEKDLPESFINNYKASSANHTVSSELGELPTQNKSIPVMERRLISLEELEKEHIKYVLSQESNYDKAAEILGITSVTLWRKRKQYNLP